MKKNSIQFNIYLCAELTANGQLLSQYECKQQQHYSAGQNERETTKTKKINQFRFLTLKQVLLKMYVSLQTAFAVETHLAEGQWLEEQVNMLKFCMFRA
jgi:hypothetical protein